MFLGAFVGAQLLLHTELFVPLALALLLLAAASVTIHRLSAAESAAETWGAPTSK